MTVRKRQDWRLDIYDDVISYAENLCGQRTELLPYFRSWLEQTSQCMRLFPNGAYIANGFENNIEHTIQMQELEKGDVSHFEMRMHLNVDYLKRTRKRLVDLLKAAQPSGLKSEDPNYHLFISYAHEDKEPFVSTLVRKLRWLHLRVWFDNTELMVGDSIRQGIDRGLAKSRFGVVVLSPAYLRKKWTKYELDGLVAREGVDFKVLLPVLYGVAYEDILADSPSLAQRVSLSAAELTIEGIALRIAEVVAST